MNRTKYQIINTVLNMLFIAVLVSAVFHFFRKSGAVFGEEFLISYAGGFIKRGLTGSFLYALDILLLLPGITLVKSFISVLMTINIILIFSTVLLKKLDAFILLSSFLVLNIYSQHIAFRLDLLLIPLFFIQLLVLRKNGTKEMMLTSILFVLGTLIHEAYFPVASFSLFYLLFFKLKIRKPIYYVAIFLPAAVCFFLSVTVFKGNPEQLNAILVSWEKFGVDPQKITYLKWLFSLKAPIFIWQNAAFIKNKLYYTGFFINYFMVCAAFYLYIRHFFNIHRKTLKAFLFGNFLVILILCFVATDFIRWYYMIFLQILFYFIIFEKKKDNILNFKYLFLKTSVLFLGLPMYGWTPTHFYWTAPVKYLIDLKDYF